MPVGDRWPVLPVGARCRAPRGWAAMCGFAAPAGRDAEPGGLAVRCPGVRHLRAPSGTRVPLPFCRAYFRRRASREKRHAVGERQRVGGPQEQRVLRPTWSISKNSESPTRNCSTDSGPLGPPFFACITEDFLAARFGEKGQGERGGRLPRPAGMARERPRPQLSPRPPGLDGFALRGSEISSAAAN